MEGRSIARSLLALTLAGCQPSVDARPTAVSVETPALPATTPAPTTPPSVPPTMRPTAVSCSDPVSDGTLLVYRDAADLWLYDATMDSSRQLTADGESRSEWAPAFVDLGCVVHAAIGTDSRPAIELLDLAPRGSTRTLVEESGSIVSIAVRPDGTELLYLHNDYGVDSTFRLKRVGIDGGPTEIVHTFPSSLGRGGSSEDEVSVAWSPDGTAILVSNTHEYSKRFPWGGIYLIDPRRDEVGARWAGTHPRWSADGRTVYFRGHGGADDGVGWRAIDVETMGVTSVGMRHGTNFAAVSPDGRYLAYDTSSFGDLPLGAEVTGEPPNVYLYDLAHDRETLLLRGGVAALWVSATEIVATNVSQGAPSANTWGGSWWDPLGTVTRISVDGDGVPAGMTSTLFDSAVLRRS